MVFHAHPYQALGKGDKLMAEEDILDIIFRPLPMFELYKPGVAKKKVLDALSTASEHLGDVETALILSSYFANDEIGDKLSEYGGTVSEFAGYIALPETVVKNFQAATKITSAVAGLKGKISDNPQAAALAFGRLFSGIGELSKYLPFPGVALYLELFAEAEYFFENIRVMTQPEVHFGEGDRHPDVREAVRVR